MSKKKKSREFNFDKEQSPQTEQSSKASLKNFGVSRPGRDTQSSAKPADLWDLTGDDQTAAQSHAVDSSTITSPVVETASGETAATSIEAQTPEIVQPGPAAAETLQVDHSLHAPETEQTRRAKTSADWLPPPQVRDQAVVENIEPPAIAKEIAPPKSKKKGKRQSVLQQVMGQAVPNPQLPAADSRPNIEFEESARNNKTEMFEKPNFAALQAAPEEAKPLKNAAAEVAPAQPTITPSPEASSHDPPAQPASQTPVTRWLPPPRKTNEIPVQQPPVDSTAHSPQPAVPEESQPVQEFVDTAPYEPPVHEFVHYAPFQPPVHELISSAPAEPQPAKEFVNNAPFEQPVHEFVSSDPSEPQPAQEFVNNALFEQRFLAPPPSVVEALRNMPQPEPQFHAPPPSEFVSSPQPSAAVSEFSNTDGESAPRPGHRRTIVQEFDLSKLVKETERQTREVKKLDLAPEPQFDTAMHYFSASAERMTYTAELRFRASYTPSEKKEAISEPPPEAAWHTTGDETASGSNDTFGFKFLNDFVPHRQELPAPPSNQGFNMLDLIDEGYRTVQPNPTFTQTRGPGKVEVAVDWVNSNGRLPPSSRDGLAGGFGGGTKAPVNQYKKNWLKK